MQLTQLYSQKSTRTMRPRSWPSVKGGEFSQRRPISGACTFSEPSSHIRRSSKAHCYCLIHDTASWCITAEGVECLSFLAKPVHANAFSIEPGGSAGCPPSSLANEANSSSRAGKGEARQAAA